MKMNETVRLKYKQGFEHLCVHFSWRNALRCYSFIFLTWVITSTLPHQANCRCARGHCMRSQRYPNTTDSYNNEAGIKTRRRHQFVNTRQWKLHDQRIVFVSAWKWSRISRIPVYIATELMTRQRMKNCLSDSQLQFRHTVSVLHGNWQLIIDF